MSAWKRSLKNLTDQGRACILILILTPLLKGSYPIISTTNRFSAISKPLVPWESDCPYMEDTVVEELAGIPFARNMVKNVK